MRWPRLTAWRTQAWRAFTLPELLVVTGIIALLLSITAPTIQLARRQAQQAKCGANLQQLGVSLENLRNSYDGFYPLWDDNSGPTRYTWIDVLVQTRFLGNNQAGYCPSDLKPEVANQARAQFYGLVYPGGGLAPGVDYSYGIGVPLSAGGWKWHPKFSPGDPLRREFLDHDSHPSEQLLAADASWTSIYNMSGDYLSCGRWNEPTQWDNTISWARHPRLKANLLMQDCHVASVQYQLDQPEPVNTLKYFVWYPGESKNVNPDCEDPARPGNGYPNVPPIDWSDKSDDSSIFPNDLNPHFYTVHRTWSLIKHK